MVKKRETNWEKNVLKSKKKKKKRRRKKKKIKEMMKKKKNWFVHQRFLESQNKFSWMELFVCESKTKSQTTVLAIL